MGTPYVYDGSRTNSSLINELEFTPFVWFSKSLTFYTNPRFSCISNIRLLDTLLQYYHVGTKNKFKIYNLYAHWYFAIEKNSSNVREDYMSLQSNDKGILLVSYFVYVFYVVNY